MPTVKTEKKGQFPSGHFFQLSQGSLIFNALKFRYFEKATNFEKSPIVFNITGIHRFTLIIWGHKRKTAEGKTA